MGQYYQPVLFKDKKVITAEAHDYENGQKLTEHGWYGSYFMGSILHYITDNPMGIVWMGDYAGDGQNDDLYNKGFADLSADAAYKMIWKEERGYAKVPKTKRECQQNGYLVNYSTKEYLNLGTFYSKCYNEEYSDALHPLALLTAIGNGAGGGDYWGTDQDLVGSWAYDTIGYVVDKPSAEFTEIAPTFIENNQ